MKFKLRLMTSFLAISTLYSGTVPGVTFRAPNIPEFLTPYSFHTVGMMIYSPELASMQSGIFSRLVLNPAALANLDSTVFYFDFYQSGISLYEPFFITFNPWGLAEITSMAFNYRTNLYVAPRWYSQTSLNTLDTKPLYSAAWLTRINPRLTLGLFNRVALDYGTYLAPQGYYWSDFYGSRFAAGYAETTTPEPSTLSLDENKQHLIHIQSQANIGYRTSSTMNVGAQIQQNIYTDIGDIHDRFSEVHPHSDVTSLNKDNLNVAGTSYILGFGVQLQPNPDLNWGISAQYGWGSGDEQRVLLDTAYSWFEDPSDITYFSTNYFYSTQTNTSKLKGNYQGLTLHAEKKLSAVLTLKTALSGYWNAQDISASITAKDTAYWDRVYDAYDSGLSDRFRQYNQYWSQHAFTVAGDGKNDWSDWSWFIMGEYHPNDRWKSFSGLYLEQNRFSQTNHESKNMRGDYWFERSLHFNETGYDRHDYEKSHTFTQSRISRQAIIPLGASIKLNNELRLIAGAELHFSLIKTKTNAEIFYPRIYDKSVRDGATASEVLEQNRYESYQNNPAPVFTRSSNHVGGLIYKPTDHLTVEVNIRGNFLTPESWVVGLQWE